MCLKVKETPYGDAVHVASADALDKVIAQTLIESEEPLSGRAFRFLRQQLGISQADLSAFIGVDVQAISGWEKEATAIPLSVDFMMRSLYASCMQKEVAVYSMVKTIKVVDRMQNSRINFNNEGHIWSRLLHPSVT